MQLRGHFAHWYIQVRELFSMARTKKACIIFFDEIDAVGGVRFDDDTGAWERAGIL